MQAWTVTEYGAYRDVLRWGEVPRPEPGPGQVLVEVRAAGISFAQILRIAGKYQVRDPVPFTPGTDVCGDVVQVGPGCTLRTGQRVMATLPRGAYAEYALVDEADAILTPDAMPPAEAAAFLNPYPTSYVGLVHQGGLQPGEWLLVHGAAGGVGLAAVQIGRALGARVIATVGSADKQAVCEEHGAEYTINYREDDFVAAVQAITQGHGADVVYDPVGGDVFDQSRRCIAFRGRLVVVGFASGRIPELAMNRVLLRNFTVTGYTLHGYREHAPALLEESRAELFRLYGEGQIKPLVSRELALPELPRALELVEHRQAVGKVVVSPRA